MPIHRISRMLGGGHGGDSDGECDDSCQHTLFDVKIGLLVGVGESDIFNHVKRIPKKIITPITSLILFFFYLPLFVLLMHMYHQHVLPLRRYCNIFSLSSSMDD